MGSKGLYTFTESDMGSGETNKLAHLKIPVRNTTEKIANHFSK